MTDVAPWVLISLSCVSLVGFGVGGLLVSDAHTKRQRQARRIADVTAPFQRSRATQLQAFRPAAARERSSIETVASLFGLSPAHTDQYPCKWWLVLGVALVVARIGSNLAADVIGPAGVLALPVFWVAGCRAFFGWAVGRRQTALLEQFPDALAMIVRSVRVGIPVLGAMNSVALEAPSPTSVEFARLTDELAVGVPIEHAVINMAERIDLSEYRFFATAISLQAQTGGGLSETLENLAELIRKRISLRQRGHALSSEARTSALMLGALPVVMGGGLSLLNPAYMSLLFRTSMGQTILGLAAGSLACGAFAMRTIIKRTLS